MGEQARVLDRMVANGVVRPQIDARFTFEGIPEALAQLESGEIRARASSSSHPPGGARSGHGNPRSTVRYHEAPGGGGTVSGNPETMPWGRFYPPTVTPPPAGSSPTVPDAWDAHVTKRPDAPAVHYSDATLGFAEIDRAVEALACVVQDRGVTRADRIAVHLQNDPRWLVPMPTAWRDVEDVLHQHPAAREACVVGVPDDYRGEPGKAFVSLVPDTSATPEELIDSCRVRMAVYEYPRRVEILDELPQNTSGKLLRRELLDQGAR